MISTGCLARNRQGKEKLEDYPAAALAAVTLFPRFAINDVAEGIELPPAARFHDLPHLGARPLDARLGCGQADAQPFGQLSLGQPFVNSQRQRLTVRLREVTYNISNVIVMLLLRFFNRTIIGWRREFIGQHCCFVMTTEIVSHDIPGDAINPRLDFLTVVKLPKALCDSQPCLLGEIVRHSVVPHLLPYKTTQSKAEPEDHRIKVGRVEIC